MLGLTGHRRTRDGANLMTVSRENAARSPGPAVEGPAMGCAEPLTESLRMADLHPLSEPRGIEQVIDETFSLGVPVHRTAFVLAS